MNSSTFLKIVLKVFNKTMILYSLRNSDFYLKVPISFRKSVENTTRVESISVTVFTDISLSKGKVGLIGCRLRHPLESCG